MIEFYISQLAASILQENVKISPLLKSQMSTAPAKADIWLLRCEKDELIKLNKILSEALDQNSQLNSGIKAMIIEELSEICEKHT